MRFTKKNALEAACMVKLNDIVPHTWFQDQVGMRWKQYVKALNDDDTAGVALYPVFTSGNNQHYLIKARGGRTSQQIQPQLAAANTPSRPVQIPPLRRKMTLGQHPLYDNDPSDDETLPLDAPRCEACGVQNAGFCGCMELTLTHCATCDGFFPATCPADKMEPYPCYCNEERECSCNMGCPKC